MERLERLVNLTAALLDADRPLTRDELRERVGGWSGDAAAFRRTFERDKDLLRQMGMPVTTEAVDPDRPEVLGYRIRRADYELPDPGLEEDELAALRLATSAVRVDGGDAATATALRKLAAPGAAGVAAPAATAEVPLDERATTVFGAVAERRLLRFEYRGATRTVEPWRLSYRNGQWYLSGWDLARAGGRTYRLDRVEGPVQVEGPAGAFERPESSGHGPARPWQIGEGASVTAEVLVDADQAQWAAGQLGADAVVERLADGSLRCEVEVTNPEALRSWVLGLLDHAEILGPPALRTSMIDWLRALAAGDGG